MEADWGATDWGAIRTDLAMEAHELAAQRRGGMIPGVTSEDEEKGPARINRVTIQTEEAGRALGKLPGYYVTVEAPALRGRDKTNLKRLADLAEEIRNYLRKMEIVEDASALVVGLGNWNATPDALGPKWWSWSWLPGIFGQSPAGKTRRLAAVCAISPGCWVLPAWRPAKSWPESSRRSAGFPPGHRRPGFPECRQAGRRGPTGEYRYESRFGDWQPPVGDYRRHPGSTCDCLGVPTVVDARTIIHDALALTGAGMGMEMNFLNIQGG